MTLKQKIFVVITLAIGFSLCAAFNVHAATTAVQPQNGGTGIGSATSGDVGNCLYVSSASPFTFGFTGCAGGTGSAYPFTPHSWGVSTSTVFGFLQGLFTNASTTIGAAFHLPKLGNGVLGVNSGLVYSGATTTYSAGTGISLSYANHVETITNSEPDQTVGFTNGTGISVTGTYPNFTVTNTGITSNTGNWAGTWQTYSPSHFQVAGTYATFGYPFPSAATSTNIDFSGGLTGNVSGNASTATTLQTARTINGVSFNGSANIVVNAASSTLLGDKNHFSALTIFTNASSTLFSTKYASSTSYYGANLGSCSGASNALTYSGGKFGCNTITGGSSFGYPFPSNSTSTKLTLSGGASIANNLTLSGITGSTQCLEVNSSGVVSGAGSACGTSSGGITSLTAGLGLNGGTITSSGTINLKDYLATSTGETKGYLPYWTSTNGTPATLGKVATTSLTVSGPLSVAGTLGSLVGGSNSTISIPQANGSTNGYLGSSDWTNFNTAYTDRITSTSFPLQIASNILSWIGLATSTNLTRGDLLYATGPKNIGQVATSTLTASSPLTGSFTQIGSGGSLGCQTASGSQAGCLSSTDWSTFNNKQSAISATWPITLSGATVGFGGLSTTTNFSIKGQLPYITGVHSFGTVATSSETCTSASGISCSAFSIIGTGGALSLSAIPNSSLANDTISGITLGSNLNSLSTNSSLTGTSYNGSAAVSNWGLNLANANSWTALQTFANATTTKLSATYASSTKAYFGTLNLPNITGTQCLHEVSGVVSGTGADCGSGGSGSPFPFTPTTNFGYSAVATTSAVWFQDAANSPYALFASSTSVFQDASSTALSVSKALYIPTVSATTSIKTSGQTAINTTSASSSILFNDGTKTRAVYTQGILSIPVASTTGLAQNGAYVIGTTKVDIGNGSASTTEVTCGTAPSWTSESARFKDGQTLNIEFGATGTTTMPVGSVFYDESINDLKCVVTAGTSASPKKLTVTAVVRAEP